MSLVQVTSKKQFLHDLPMFSRTTDKNIQDKERLVKIKYGKGKLNIKVGTKTRICIKCTGLPSTVSLPLHFASPTRKVNSAFSSSEHFGIVSVYFVSLLVI